MLEPRPYRNLHLYNTLSGEVEEFSPLSEQEVKLYVCGITPYEVGHLGHALTAVAFDVLRRWLDFNGYTVRHIQNITDVDDDMVRVSEERDLSIAELTDINHQIYLDEMSYLNILPPDSYPRVSETIDEIILGVNKLVDTGFAYENSGYVFFDSTQDQSLGALIGLDNSQLASYESDSMPAEPAELKRSPLDFLIWQPSSFPGAKFESPWGVGRPGWHIECSIMAQTHLGDQLDIHGGGKDLRYPHHASEIAQSESITSRSPYVSYWMHNGTMRLEGVKMSKSLGNLVRVSELIEQGYSGNDIRLDLARVQYREDRDYDSDRLAENRGLAGRLQLAAASNNNTTADIQTLQSYRTRFQNAMDNDLDTPEAIDVLVELAEAIIGNDVASEHGSGALTEMASVLGLHLRSSGD